MAINACDSLFAPLVHVDVGKPFGCGKIIPDHKMINFGNIFNPKNIGVNVMYVINAVGIAYKLVSEVIKIIKLIKSHNNNPYEFVNHRGYNVYPDNPVNQYGFNNNKLRYGYNGEVLPHQSIIGNEYNFGHYAECPDNFNLLPKDEQLKFARFIKENDLKNREKKAEEEASLKAYIKQNNPEMAKLIYGYEKELGDDIDLFGEFDRIVLGENITDNFDNLDNIDSVFDDNNFVIDDQCDFDKDGRYTRLYIDELVEELNQDNEQNKYVITDEDPIDIIERNRIERERGIFDGTI